MLGKRIILALLTLSVLAGCESTPAQQRLEPDDVASMEKVKNYDGLISHYKSELKKGSQDTEIKEKLAWAYFYKGDLESANFYVQYLKKEGVENSNLYQLEGQVFDAKNDTENAISSYKASIKVGNQTGQIHVLLGVAYTKAGRYKEAYQELDKARLRGFDDIAIKNNIAMIHMAKGEFDQAIETLVPILKQDPGNKIVKANLAVALMKTHKVESAKKLLKGDFSDQELQSIATELAQK
ncbi:tetratricopeptide repeat protein [Vibrio artabrorum]|uniref:tetratricopeptide repeat protein n=1 Tax=Vibrio artabrorum TaxID=446374 RepID=UPI00354ECEF1